MIFHKIFFPIVLFFSLNTVASEQTQNDQILAQLKSHDSKIKEIVGTDKTDFTPEQKNKIAQLFDAFFNFDLMAQEVLDSHWKELSSAQHHEFITSFSSLIKESSLRDLSLYQSQIRYKKVKVTSENRADADVNAVKGDKRVKVKYKLSLTPPLNWKVFDFLLDGVSTVESYRTSFNKIIREKGFPQLISKINKKIEKLKKSKKEK